MCYFFYLKIVHIVVNHHGRNFIKLHRVEIIGLCLVKINPDVIEYIYHQHEQKSCCSPCLQKKSNMLHYPLFQHRLFQMCAYDCPFEHINTFQCHTLFPGLADPLSSTTLCLFLNRLVWAGITGKLLYLKETPQLDPIQKTFVILQKIKHILKH